MSSISNKTKAQAEILKAMSHPSRLFMMQELQSGERCVCELQDAVSSDISTVSKHLSVLRNAGLVEMDKRGTKVFYRLTTPCILKISECIDIVLQANADHRQELLK